MTTKPTLEICSPLRNSASSISVVLESSAPKMSKFSQIFFLALILAIRGQNFNPNSDPDIRHALHCKRTGNTSCMVANVSLDGLSADQIWVRPSNDLNGVAITSLVLRDLLLGYLPLNLFNNFGHLQLFSARNCSLGELRTVALPASIKVFSVTHNEELASLDLPIVEGDLRYLKVINLDHNSISMISVGVFDRCTNPDLLIRLSYNRIEALSPGVFPSNVKKLYLNENMIRHIDNPFSQMYNLEVLDVSDNIIESVDDWAFNHLISLRELNLASNELITIPKNVFKNCRNLRMLLIYGNRMDLMEEQRVRNEELYWAPIQTYFLRCQSIYDVYHCDIKGEKQMGEHVEFKVNEETNADIAFNRWKITKIDVSHTPIGTFPSNILRYCPIVSHLSLVNCSIHNANNINGTGRLVSFTLSHNNLTAISGDFFESDAKLLNNLDLSFNQIERVNENAFRRLKNDSIKLNLESNAIKEIQNDTFRQIPGLIELNLRENQLIDIKHLFTGLRRLEKLDLSSNFLKTIHYEDFKGLKRIKDIRLEKNEIAFIAPDTFVRLPRIHFLDLSKNQLSNSILLDFRETVSLNIVKIEDNQLGALEVRVGFNFTNENTSQYYVTKIKEADNPHRVVTIYHKPLYKSKVLVKYD